MRIGAIDIGTNSMRLLTADYEDGKLKNRRKFVNTTRIGEGVDKTGNITEGAIDRNIEALVEFKAICGEEGCERLYCMGTSALRDAKNSSEFIRRAKEEAGIEVEILPGEKEADLGLIGVIEGLDSTGSVSSAGSVGGIGSVSNAGSISSAETVFSLKSDENSEELVLVLDIGGGSTEFVVGNSHGIRYNKSENVGALRMTEKFLSKDQVNSQEYLDMEEFLNKQILGTVEIVKSMGIKKLIGIGGTITSLSAMNQKLEVYSMEKVHNSKICKKDVELILQNLKKMSVGDKKALPGLQEKRADIITAGVEILNITMKKLGFEEITVSEYDNLEGIICEKEGNL
ncbi:MAG: Ppx/GppA family phosphatase [Clostridioides sp.]|jgi:exopolyphosphatase/guanosine-5'-triphosphate,3'-diphosphate pyrophosphatase|nr:Ppx/GppA family phosphatase [Clostridioides sp.]